MYGKKEVKYIWGKYLDFKLNKSVGIMYFSVVIFFFPSTKTSICRVTIIGGFLVQSQHLHDEIEENCGKPQ